MFEDERVPKKIKITAIEHTCDVCRKSFTRKDNLTDHINAIHLGLKPHTCDECNMNFSLKSNLARHVKTVHLGLKHQCDQCKMNFAQKGSLINHINAIHLGLKNHPCDKCNMNFALKGNLARHVKTVHLGEKPHKCDECGKLFSHESDLRRHVDSHEKSKSWTFVCTFKEGRLHTEDECSDGIPCGVRCEFQWGLNYHIQAAHTDEGLRKKHRSETQCATFFDSKNSPYDRDRVNHVSLICKPDLKLSGSRCFPDFYMLAFSAKLNAHTIFGNDENNHRQYPCDLRRTLEMTTAISSAPGNFGVKIVYIRFNPHFYTVDGIVYDRPLSVLHEEMWNILESLTAESLIHDGLNLIYINYDQVSVTEAKPTELWRRMRLFVHLDENPDDENSENALLLRDLVIGVY